MSIAGALGDLYFTQHYKRGAILKFNMECDDPNRDMRYKFGIVLNKNIEEDEALLAITTTNHKYFDTGRLEDDILRINVGEYPCFDKATIISLREIRPEPVADLKTLCTSNQLTFHGVLTEADLTVIEQKIIHSKVIEGKYKKRIV
jgi:hypothetical protein